MAATPSTSLLESQAPDQHQPRTGLRSEWGLLAVYAVLLAFAFLAHEMWRDEYEQLQFRRFNGFVDDGSPFYIAYNLICWGAIQLNDSIFAYRLAHYVVAVCAVAVLFTYGPFKLWQKTLLLLNYFLLYEYGCISRYYSLICLTVFGITAILTHATLSFAALAVLILVVASINPLSASFAIGFVVYLTYEIVYGKLRETAIKQWRDFMLSLGLLVIGGGIQFIAAVAYVLRPDGLKPFECARPPAYSLLPQLWNAYVPIPDPSREVDFWWTNIFPTAIAYPPNWTLGWEDVSRPAFVVPAVISVAMFSVSCLFLRQDKAVLCFYVLTTALQLLLIAFAVKTYVSRYLGFLFVTFLTAAWLFFSRNGVPSRDSALDAGRPTSKFPERDRLWGSAFRLLFAGVLIAQAFAGLWALRKDALYKFSQSGSLCHFVKVNRLHETHQLVGYGDAHTQCIAAELNVDVYFPQVSKFGRYCEAYNPNRRPVLALEEILSQSKWLAAQAERPVALVLNIPLFVGPAQPLGERPEKLDDKTSIRLLKAIDEPVICRDEVYWIYEIGRLPSEAL